MELNAIKRVHRYFTWARVAKLMVAVYDEVLQSVNEAKGASVQKAPVYVMPAPVQKLKKIK
jgi:hypothetical protein